MSSWLGAIVQNTAHEHLRSRRNRVFVSIEYLSKQDNEVVEIDLPDPGKNPEETWRIARDGRHPARGGGQAGLRVPSRAIELCVLEEEPQLTPPEH